MANKKGFQLGCGNVVKLRNGNIGAVGCFGENVAWIIFKAYMSTIDKYNEELKYVKRTGSNPEYDIVAVYDGSGIGDAKTVFKSSFSLEELPLLWEEDKA